MELRDIAGMKFGRLLVIGRVSSLNGKVRWLVECECGNHKILPADSIMSGKTKSCGCLKNRKAEEHPLWRKGLRAGYVRVNHSGRRDSEHRFMAEKALGKQLPPLAVIHHFDETRSHNERGNIVLCQDRAYHNFIHERLRAYKATGHANWKKCPYCKSYDDPKNMHHRKDRDKYRHVECHKRYMKEYKGRNRAA